MRKGGRLWSFAGSLWSFFGSLWSFVVVCDGLWSFVVVACFSNYDSKMQKNWMEKIYL